MAMKAGCKFGVRPETEACVNCKHFYQHYIWAASWGFTKIYTGHWRLSKSEKSECERLLRAF